MQEKRHFRRGSSMQQVLMMQVQGDLWVTEGGVNVRESVISGDKAASSRY